ncbi:Dynein heavy chain 14, axonemal [Myotis davidii]|uniref:Dynein heavy chain 14, axonemal n=1 Tax=Myotis davidii TaxID=225400 RepID=L5M1I4_MYODS|nr:Dynein heavy chain 14, axonemal [Myotis davidii]
MRTAPGSLKLTRNLLLSEAFLTAVLQDYGRAHGISTDALTFTHQVIPSTIGPKEEEFSIIVQKTLNLVRRAFKVSTEAPAAANPPESEGHTFECPVYQTPQRSSISTTTGSPSHCLTSVFLPTRRPPSHWITMQVALLCEKHAK